MSMPSPLRSRADSMPLPCMMMSLAPAGSGANMASCWTPMFCSAVLLGMTLAMRNLVFFPTSVCRLAPIPMTSSASQWSNVLQSSSASGRSDMGTRLGGSGSARSRVPRVCAAAGCRCISIGEGLRAHAHELVVRGRGTCSLPLISGGQPRGPAIRPLAPTGGRMTDDVACVVWRAYGRPCAARARRRSGGRSRDSSSTVSAGTAG